MSVSIKKTGVVSVSGGTNMNLMPNSYIMPLGTNNPVTGTWRLAGSNNMTRSRVLIENGMYGFQNSGIQTTPSGGYSDASCYGINSFPMEANTDYILSMWARITEGTEGYAGYSIYASSYVDGSDTKTDRGYRVTPLTKEWQRVWIHFRTNATENRNIYIGITTGETEVTTQMCLIKLEKGSVLTPWIPFLTDDIAVADYSTTTLSGEIVSFNDGALSGVKLDSLKVLVEAQQDLHGYDKPWAGGGGKNKLSYVAGTTSSANNITMIINDDGSVKATSSGASTGSHFFLYNTIYLPVGTYYLYATVNGTPWAYDPNGKFRIYVAYNGLGYNFGGTLNVTDASKSITVYVQGFGNKTFNNTVNPMICEGSTPPTAWQPYANICPITGWSGANVTRTGKNVWNEQAESGSIIPATGVDVANANKIRSVGFISVKPNTTYNIVFADTTAGSDYLYYYKKDGTFINSESYVHTVSGNKTFTTPTDCYNLRFIMSLTEYNNKISVNYPSTDTAYHAYNGNTYTIAFGDTYYGGELDVTNGVLRVVKAIIDMGSLSYTKYDVAEGTLFRTQISGAKLEYNVDNLLCSAYHFELKEQRANGTYSIPDNVGNLDFINNSYSDATAFKTAMTGQTVCYELATPFTIQLTPTVIMQLKNQNNIWCDTGIIDECKYVSHSSQVDANFIETHPLLTQVNNSYINSNNFIEI